MLSPRDRVPDYDEDQLGHGCHECHLPGFALPVQTNANGVHGEVVPDGSHGVVIQEIVHTEARPSQTLLRHSASQGAEWHRKRSRRSSQYSTQTSARAGSAAKSARDGIDCTDVNQAQHIPDRSGRPAEPAFVRSSGNPNSGVPEQLRLEQGIWIRPTCPWACSRHTSWVATAVCSVPIPIG